MILVRNDAARSRLLVDAPELAMAKAQILTVAEAKGLEYNDVFIWDLCADSPCKAEWRAVAHAAASLLESRGLLPEEQFPPSADILPHFQPLPFDPRAHALLGECLKLFYVAMTRARRRVVVFDRCPRQRAALFAFLGSAVWGAAPPLACAPASTSSAEESGSAGEGGTALFPVAELCGLVQFRKGVKGSSKSGDIEKSGAVRPAAGLAQVSPALPGTFTDAHVMASVSGSPCCTLLACRPDPDCNTFSPLALAGRPPQHSSGLIAARHLSHKASICRRGSGLSSTCSTTSAVFALCFLCRACSHGLICGDAALLAVFVQAGTAFRNAQSPERVCAALGKLAFLRGEDSKEEEERRALLLWVRVSEVKPCPPLRFPFSRICFCVSPPLP